MLLITLPAIEMWDDARQEFISAKEQTLQLEHSLVSLSKWESKWKKAFLSKHEKTVEETLDYIKCMTVTRNVSPDVYSRLTNQHIEMINNYIADPMTASVLPEDKNAKGGRETVTAELIYYWMISLNIPFECRTWHLNSLLSLIKVCNFKNTPPKKMSRKELTRRNAALNAQRRAKHNTKG